MKLIVKFTTSFDIDTSLHEAASSWKLKDSYKGLYLRPKFLEDS